MRLSTARDWVWASVRDSGDSTMFEKADVDRAIIYAGQHFCRETKAVRKAVDIDLEEGETTVDLTAAIALGFTPEKQIDLLLTDPAKEDPIRVVDYAELNAARACNSTQTGIPEMLAFADSTTAKVFPTPDDDYTMTLRFWQPFIAFEPGTDDSTVLSIPDEYLPSLLSDGAAAYLLAPSPKRMEGYQGWVKFLAYIDRLRGAGSFGVKKITRVLKDQSVQSARRVIRESF